MSKIAILQSNYIPWKGYFDIINSVDTFIFHDDLQYTKNDWRNRNKIKTPDGVSWLSIPCGSNEKRFICDVELPNGWEKKHWNIIQQHYSKTPYFKDYKPYFAKYYEANKWSLLSDFNQAIIKGICQDILNINTIFEDSRIYNLSKTKEERVLELLKKAKCTHYLSGPAAKSYINENNFISEGIKVEWMDYSNYPEYPQLHPPFEHGVSILDLIFNVGPDAYKYLKSF